MLPRRVSLVLAGVLLALPLAACSNDSGSSGEGAPITIQITEADGKVTASEDLVTAKTGQRITLEVTSDVADEIHVHSVPDHEFEVRPGKEETFTFAVNTPGTVEVESHGLEQTILKLEIS